MAKILVKPSEFCGLADLIMQAKLPKFLKPTSTGSFVRLGKNNDGGYIIDKNAMQNAHDACNV